MAQNAPIVLADGQATPVNHTFSPVSVNGDIATYYDRSSGIASAFPQLTLSLRNLPSSQVARVSFRVKVPVVDATSAVLRTADVEISMRLPRNGTLAERADILAYAKNLLSTSVAASMVKDLEFVW